MPSKPLRLRGHLDIVQILLEKGADINAQGGDYGNALYAASREGHLDIVQILLEKEVPISTPRADATAMPSKPLRMEATSTSSRSSSRRCRYQRPRRILRQCPPRRFVWRPPRHRPDPPREGCRYQRPRRILRQCPPSRFGRRPPRHRPDAPREGSRYQRSRAETTAMPSKPLR